MLEPIEDEESIQLYDVMEGTAEEKLDEALDLREMGNYRPRNLFPQWVEQTPFPENYELPNFTKYEGHGSPDKHIKGFLRHCEETAKSQALCL